MPSAPALSRHTGDNLRAAPIRGLCRTSFSAAVATLNRRCCGGLGRPVSVLLWQLWIGAAAGAWVAPFQCCCGNFGSTLLRGPGSPRFSVAVATLDRRCCGGLGRPVSVLLWQLWIGAAAGAWVAPFQCCCGNSGSALLRGDELVGLGVASLCVCGPLLSSEATILVP